MRHYSAPPRKQIKHAPISLALIFLSRSLNVHAVYRHGKSHCGSHCKFIIKFLKVFLMRCQVFTRPDMCVVLYSHNHAGETGSIKSSYIQE
jgi:hypothetical protein